MGVFDALIRRRHEHDYEAPHVEKIEPPVNIPVGDNVVETVGAFSNKNIILQGEPTKINIKDIFVNPQNRIQLIWQLCSYYSQADEIVHSAIYNCFIPYLCSPEYYLDGAKKKTIDIFNEYYKKIRLSEKIENIITELCLYGNVFVYIYNGVPITLPVNKIRIKNTTLDGQPIIEFNTESLREEIKPKDYYGGDEYVPDENKDYVMLGYPPEIRDAALKHRQWAQLNPANVFVLQLPKEGWVRYAIPWIVAALPALQRKEFIKEYERVQLNTGCVSAVHVKYGDDKKGADMLPDGNQLNFIRKLFTNGFKSGRGNGVIVTNQLAKAEILNKSIGDMYQWDMYSNVNDAILAAAGISGIVATGVSSEGSSFSSAQVSMQVLEARLEKILHEIEELINRMNERFPVFMNQTYNLKEIPKFKFKPVSLQGKKALREAVLELYNKGLVSSKTTIESYGYSNEVENERKSKEPKTKETVVEKTSEPTGDVGRPTMDDTERNSPIENSLSGNIESKLDNTI